MIIYLIGFRCTGKSTVGESLARLLDYPFEDLDRSIEDKTSATITSMVENRGWDYFRSIEKQALMGTADYTDAVIATGGGVVLDPENVSFMRNVGTTVLLTASEDIILQRLLNDKRTEDLRPSITGTGTEKETKDVYRYRRPIYRKSAMIEVDTSMLMPLDVALEIKGD